MASDSLQSPSSSETRSDDDFAQEAEAARTFLYIQDSFIDNFAIPAVSLDESGAVIEAGLHLREDIWSRLSFNRSLVHDIRFRNCMFLLAAGLPNHAITEFASLETISFNDLDRFFVGLSKSVATGRAYNWFVENSELIAKLLSHLEEAVLRSGFKIFAGTCMQCAFEDKDYELAEHIADASDMSPPYDCSYLVWICITYYSRPQRGEDARKWAEIAIANRCLSASPFIIKCRSLLVMGDFDAAISCLDLAERFCYANGLQGGYAQILHERSTIMDHTS